MKKYLGKLTAVALVLTMASTSLVGGTLAKYTEEVSGTATTSVAKWDIDVSADGNTSFADAASTYSFVQNWNDTNNEVTDNLLAPGTSGHFTVTVTNSSEVAVDYSTVAAITNEGDSDVIIPMQYSVVKWTGESAPDAGTYTTASYTSDEDAVTELATITGQTLAAGATATYEVYWQWAVDGTDASDTILGAAEVAYTLELTTTVTQDVTDSSNDSSTST